MDGEPDVEIGASVRAKKMRFHKKPKTDVRVEGKADVRVDGDLTVDGESGSTRENLPEEVEPGVTYRDVRVAWHAAGRLVPEERTDDD